MSEPLCNLCGLTCVIGPESNREVDGLINAQVCGGYESTPGNGWGALDDLTRYTFSLCEFCLDWLFAQFVIPVRTDDQMNDYALLDGETLDDGMKRMGMVRVMGVVETAPWRPAAERVLTDEWRKMRSEFFAEQHRRAAARGARRPHQSDGSA